MVFRRVALLAALGACKGEIAGGSADGARVFAEACAMCHGPTGKPNAAMVAQMGVRDLTAPDLRARITRERVIDQVRRGSDNGIMPAFGGKLSDPQIDAVADYVIRELARARP
jgi:mono/diheme cytochrome c family protein